MRRNCETAITGRSATRHVVLMLGVKSFATGVTMIALTVRVHSDGAIPLRRKFVCGCNFEAF